MIFGLSHERWRLYTCSDCHPDYADSDDEDAPKFETAYQVILPFEPIEDLDDGGTYRPENPEGACPINTCPRCGSYLSLGSDCEVRVEVTRR